METYKSGLNAELTMTEPCVMQLNAVVPAVNGKKTYKDVLTYYTARVPRKGFRAGHVPQSMILSLHGKEICEETAERLLNATMAELIEAKDLKLSGSLDLEGGALPAYVPDQDFAIKATLEVYPEFTLPSHKGLKATRKKVQVEQKKVDEASETFLRMHGKYEPVSRPAQPGDMLKVDFKTDAPEELKEDPRAKYLVEGTNSWQIMREPESIPGITAALTGVSVGESKEVDVTFPGDFRVEALAGKSLHYTFTINEIQGFEPPAFDEKFIAETGLKDMDEVKKSIRQRMEDQQERNAANEVYEQVVAAFQKQLDFPLPPALVARTMEEATRRMEEELKSRNLSPEELEKTRQERLENLQKEIPANLRLVHALDELAKQEKVTLDNNDYFNYCVTMAQSMRTDLDHVISEIRKNRGAWERMETDLRRQKAIALLVDNADVTIVGEDGQPLPPEEAAPAKEPAPAAAE